MLNQQEVRASKSERKHEMNDEKENCQEQEIVDASDVSDE
jgi:hypothetical protein